MQNWSDMHNFVDGEQSSALWWNQMVQDILHNKQASDRPMLVGLADVPMGTLCVQDSSADDKVGICPSAGHGGPFWVALEPITAGNEGWFRAATYAQLRVTGTVSPTDTLQSSATPGVAVAGSTNWFATAMTASAGGYVIARLRETGSGGVLTTHTHASGGGTGGPLSAASVASSLIFDEVTPPSSPAADKLAVYAKDSAGNTVLAVKNSAGAETVLGGGAQTAQNFTEGSPPTSPVAGLVTLYATTGKQLYTIDSTGKTRPLGGGPYVDLTKGASPTNPPSSDIRVYAKNDGLVYQRNSAGTETALGGGGGGGGGSNTGYDDRGYTRSSAPDSTMFPTWRNQGSCTLTDVAGIGLRIVMPGQATDSWHMRSLPCPAVPFTRTFELVGHFMPGQYHKFGAGVFNSSNNDFYFGGVQIANGSINPLGQQWSDFGSFAGGAGDYGAVVVFDTHFWVEIVGHATDPTQWKWRMGQGPENWGAYITWNMSNIWAGTDPTQLHLFFGLTTNSGVATGLAHTVTCLSYS